MDLTCLGKRVHIDRAADLKRMSNLHYYALTNEPLPPAIHGTDLDCSVRTLFENERLTIEDYFFGKNVKIALSPTTTAVVVSESQTAGATMEELAVLIEFALAILTIAEVPTRDHSCNLRLLKLHGGHTTLE